MARMKYHIKKDDTVMVIAGKETGKTGKVLKIILKKNRVVVEKINFVKRHARPSQTHKGGIIEKEGSIHITNLMVMCEKCNKPVRVGKRILEDGKKVRICRSCEDVLDKI
ncbi:MAG: 50S ribosomal protein L24 [Deltaproteobacteria bacterium]|nr:50S ribosomal protein L24 [Deltaproteobacteria bacterium]MBW2308730.1 50S ribosomal protein L24 [Deltaproteobacteria bacterium]